MQQNIHVFQRAQRGPIEQPQITLNVGIRQRTEYERINHETHKTQNERRNYKFKTKNKRIS
jgi:hypothetical protein